MTSEDSLLESLLRRPAFWSGPLLLATAAVYAPVLGFEFVRADDAMYVTGNHVVQRGLTLAGIRWAFTAVGAASNWHPLTWLSHMLDVQLFGLAPGWHHATSLALHLVATLLLYGLMRDLTRRPGASALVAGLFALHPLHVESVAWVSERKDVLSTALGLLATRAYVAHARGEKGALRRAELLLGLSLLAKPMLVTLPFVWLLLDYAPLGRLRIGSFGALPPEPLAARPLSVLLREKALAFALVAGSCALTLVAQRGALEAGEVVDLLPRAANAVVAYARYLALMLWPANLGVLYPHPDLPRSGADPRTAWEVAAALLLLLGISGAVLWTRSRSLLVAWLFYLGTLVPVVGLVQVGHQAMADRYTYVPLIGPFAMLVFAGAALARRLEARVPRAQRGAAALALCALLALAFTARAQVLHWRSSLTLFEQAVRVAPRSPLMQLALSAALADEGRLDEAVRAGERALALDPELADAHSNLGTLRRAKGQLAEAIEHHRRAVALAPGLALAHRNLGNALLESGRRHEAIGAYRRALAITPDPEVHHALATALREAGEPEEALEHYRRALEIDPGFVRARVDWGQLLSDRGDLAGAAEQYRQALVLTPDDARAQYRLERTLEALAAQGARTP